MTQLALQIPQVGGLNSIEDPELASDMNAIQTWANGSIDSSNLSSTANIAGTQLAVGAVGPAQLSAAVAQSAGVNQSSPVQTVKGASNIATSESRTNTAYGTLTTPDQVSGIVLPANGLIQVWYQATWQESVAGAARAAIFIGASQMLIATAENGSPQTVAAATGQFSGAASHSTVLTSSPMGLISNIPVPYGGDVTTGQAVGLASISTGALGVELGGTVEGLSPQTSGFTAFVGGPCTIFAAAGTYAISVQFKSSSGSVTASNRKLWVSALSFS